MRRRYRHEGKKWKREERKERGGGYQSKRERWTEQEKNKRIEIRIERVVGRWMEE
jgi:hypothetical protein